VELLADDNPQAGVHCVHLWQLVRLCALVLHFPEFYLYAVLRAAISAHSNCDIRTLNGHTLVNNGTVMLSSNTFITTQAPASNFYNYVRFSQRRAVLSSFYALCGARGFRCAVPDFCVCSVNENSCFVVRFLHQHALASD
jgi:hypothetical protein